MIFALMLALSLAAAPPDTTPQWGCSTNRSIVENHVASLTFADDGTFALRHTNSTEYAGTSLTMNGTWQRGGDTLVLTPTSGDRRFWIGDGHRFDHGENVRFCQWSEPLPGGPRRVDIKLDPEGVESFYLAELKTRLFSGGDTDCDAVRPSPSPSPGYRCETPPR